MNSWLNIVNLDFSIEKQNFLKEINSDKVILIGTDFLSKYEDIQNSLLFNLSKVKWIITVGINAKKWENEIDNFIEYKSIFDDDYLNIVTTSYEPIDNEEYIIDIIYEFLKTSCVTSTDTIFISLLNKNVFFEKLILEEIKKQV